MMDDSAFVLVFALFYVTILVLAIVGWCMIGKRLGYSPFAGLLMLIPLVGLFVFLYWAFSESPNETKIRRLEIIASQYRDQSTAGYLAGLQQQAPSPTNFLADLERRD